MKLGPSYLLECPTCAKKYYNRSISSMNNFGATLYSDGKQIGPMLQEFPSIVKCDTCNTFFWCSDSELKQDDYLPETINQFWATVEPVKFLNKEELHTCLETSAIRSKDDLAFVRQRIWWGYNDRVRSGKPLFISEADKNKWLKNLIHLKTTSNSIRLDSISNAISDGKKLLVAEMCRNLGNFEECLELIDTIVDPSLDWLQEKFRELCNKEDTLVFLVRK